AISMAVLLQQLFLGTGGLGAPRAGGPTGPGGLPTPATPTPALTAGGIRPLQLTLGGTTPEGAPLIELRITVDERTNSVIVAGSRNALDVIQALISRLEDSSVNARRNEVYRLRNSVAADIANALNDFLSRTYTVQQLGGQFTPFQILQRE